MRCYWEVRDRKHSNHLLDLRVAPRTKLSSTTSSSWIINYTIRKRSTIVLLSQFLALCPLQEFYRKYSSAFSNIALENQISYPSNTITGSETSQLLTWWVAYVHVGSMIGLIALAGESGRSPALYYVDKSDSCRRSVLDGSLYFDIGLGMRR